MVHAEDSAEIRSLMISKIYFDIMKSDNNRFLRDRYLEDTLISKIASYDGENIYIDTKKLNGLSSDNIDTIYSSMPGIEAKAEIDSYSLSFVYNSKNNKETERFIFRLSPSNGWRSGEMYIDKKVLPNLFDDVIAFCLNEHPLHGRKKSRCRFKDIVTSKITLEYCDYKSVDAIPDWYTHDIRINSDGDIECIITIVCDLSAVHAAFDSVRNKYLDKFDIQYPITVDKLI